MDIAIINTLLITFERNGLNRKFVNIDETSILKEAKGLYKINSLFFRIRNVR